MSAANQPTAYETAKATRDAVDRTRAAEAELAAAQAAEQQTKEQR